MVFYLIVFWDLNYLIVILLLVLLHLNFLIPHSEHFDCIINLPFFVLKIFEFKFSGFFCTSRNRSACSFVKYISKEKNVLLTVLTHTRRLFYQKTFYQSNIQSILILILLFCFILRLVFLNVYIQCIFYSFYNKYPCFIIWKRKLMVSVCC